MPPKLPVKPRDPETASNTGQVTASDKKTQPVEKILKPTITKAKTQAVKLETQQPHVQERKRILISGCNSLVGHSLFQ